MAKNILVVDDDQAVVEKIRAALTSHLGYGIAIAYNGKEALDDMKVRELPYDLIVLAILIPKLNGIEVCQAMVQDEKLKEIPVLLTSILPLDSRAFRKSMKKFPELTVVKEILEKPFDDKELLAKVKSIVEA